MSGLGVEKLARNASRYIILNQRVSLIVTPCGDKEKARENYEKTRAKPNTNVIVKIIVRTNIHK